MMHIKAKVLIASLMFLSNGVLFGQITEAEAFSIGEHITFESAVLGESRIINVYLPNGYEDNIVARYPIIYLLDGSRDEDFIHIAGLVQFCSFSWINIIPESIVVGIGNVDRRRDFTYPTTVAKDKKDFPTAGGSAAFIEFIREEIQPMINNRFRVNLEGSTLIGQSLGGLLATEILFKQPELFDHYVIISPSLWWDDESLLEFDAQILAEDRQVYIGVGKEGEVMERVARQLYEKLDAVEQNSNRLFYQYFEEQNHGDALHLAVYDAFTKLFKAVED